MRGLRQHFAISLRLHFRNRIALLYGDEWPQVKVKNLATREESLIPSDALLDSVAKFFTLSGSV